MAKSKKKVVKKANTKPIKKSGTPVKKPIKKVRDRQSEGGNTNAIFRMTILDRCLGAGTYTIKGLIQEVERELLEKLGPNKNGDPPSASERTIKKDIADMQKTFPNCVIDEKLKNRNPYIYKYKDPNYSIFGLSKRQKKKIAQTLSVLSHFAGQPQFEWIKEKVAEIRHELDIKAEKDIPEVMSFETYYFYEFQEGKKAITHPGLEYVSAIFNAIVNTKRGRVLEIYYRDFENEKPYLVTFHPYYLKQFNQRWYAIGYNPAKDIDTWVLAIDRIEKDPTEKIPPIREVDDVARPNSKDWKEHFEDIIGVTKYRKKEPITITIHIKDYIQKEYIRTRPLHISQKPFKELPGGGYVTSIEVIPNYELYKLLLSFGERIEVVSPKEVREEMQKKIEGMNKMYK